MAKGKAEVDWEIVAQELKKTVEECQLKWATVSALLIFLDEKGGRY